jgi:hypothetical protein
MDENPRIHPTIAKLIFYADILFGVFCAGFAVLFVVFIVWALLHATPILP